MRHLLNTFFVSTDGAYIHRKGEQLEVCLDHEVIGSVPSHILQSLVCFGRISVSPGAMALCAEHEISISFIDMFGHFVAKVTPPVYGNVLLRREQYRHADNPGKASEYARNMLIGKIANSRKILQRAIREKNMSSKAEPFFSILKCSLTD